METCHHQKEKPKLHNQLELNHRLFPTTRLTQFPQSHNVRSASALASGNTTAQKYEKSVRCTKLEIRALNLSCLLRLDSYSAIKRPDTNFDSHASDSRLVSS